MNGSEHVQSWEKHESSYVLPKQIPPGLFSLELSSDTCQTFKPEICRLNPKRPNVFVVVLGCFVCFSAGTQTQDLAPGRQALHLFVPSETTWFGNEESPSCPLSVENRNRPGPFLAQATTVKYFCYHLFFEKGSPVTMNSWSSCLHLPNTGIQLNQSSY